MLIVFFSATTKKITQKLSKRNDKHKWYTRKYLGDIKEDSNKGIQEWKFKIYKT